MAASDSGAAPTLESVRDELYTLLPDAFVAARTSAEKAARRSGDRDTANAIKALGKPSVVAWLANQLVRTHRDEVVPLLELGAELREATRSLSGEQLRLLSQQQQKVILALVRQGRAVAKQAGQQVTEATASGLEETLRAALADEELADQLAAGCLTTGLQFVGFGLMGGGSPAPTRLPKPAKASRKAESPDAAAERRAAALRLAEEDVTQARAAAEQAFDVERHARSARDDADASATTAGESVAALEQQLAEARARQDEADQAAAQARTEHEDAETALDQARTDLDDAEAREQEARSSTDGD